MNCFDALYAGFFGKYSPLWDEIKKECEIIDVEYEDLSDELNKDESQPAQHQADSNLLSQIVTSDLRSNSQCLPSKSK